MLQIAQNAAFKRKNSVLQVGRLSVNAKNAFNLFIERVFANLRQNNVVFVRITKIATKI